MSTLAEHQERLADDMRRTEFMQAYVDTLNATNTASDHLIKAMKAFKKLEKTKGKIIQSWANSLHWDAEIFNHQEAYDKLADEIMAVNQIAFLTIQSIDLKTGRLPNEEIE